MRKCTTAVFLTVLLVSSLSFAQQPASSDQASTEDVLQMFKEMHFEQQVTAVQTAVMQQMKGTFQHLMNDEKFRALPPEKQAKLREMLDQDMKDAVNIYPIKEMIADFAPMYAKYLTKADIQAITAFYHSPTGQKMLEKNPEITRDAMAIVGPKINQRMTEYMEKTQKQVMAMVNEGSPATQPETEKSKN